MFVVYYYIELKNTYHPDTAIIVIGQDNAPFTFRKSESQWIVPGTVDVKE